MSDSAVLKRETHSRFQRVNEGASFRIPVKDCGPTFDPEPAYPGSAASSSSSPPSPLPPPFSSLYFLPTSTPIAVDQAKVFVTEPNPFALYAFAPAWLSDNPSNIPSAAELEVKAALPPDNKAESSSSKGLDDAEPPPPYTEGSSPLDGFTYVMAAAGGAASIITQVQQGAPAPVNTLGGTIQYVAAASVPEGQRKHD